MLRSHDKKLAINAALPFSQSLNILSYCPLKSWFIAFFLIIYLCKEAI